MTPAIVINGHPYRGKLEGYDIFRAICQAFPLGHEPIVCDPGYDIQQALGKEADFEVIDEPEPISWSRNQLVEICIMVSICTLLLGFYLMRLFRVKQARNK